MPKDKKIQNAFKRSEVHRKTKRAKEQAKLQRRLEIKKAEKDKVTGAALRAERLSKNIPVTLDNTRVYDSSSYLTANPASLQNLAEKAEEASALVNGGKESREVLSNGEEECADFRSSSDQQEDVDGSSEVSDQEIEDEMDEEDQEASARRDITIQPPPRILITTSPSPCKQTYQFCDDLKNVFPGGEFFKRPKGKGFEIGRVSRWASKRGYGALIVVNEDHKIPNAVTLINLPSGPTAYFKLSSITLSSNIYGHARSTPHSPELILNNFTTLLGNSVGRLFGSLFPPQPQFRGRQVVTLHNQRDFLFFRRHRYMFSSATSAKLQEIGPRFTLKLRWLRKGLPSVAAADGHVSVGGDPADDIYGADVGPSSEEIAQEEKDEEDEALKEIGQPAQKKNAYEGTEVPALDEEQEYEWKWKPKMEVSRRTFFL
ncbi:ribosome production factor 1 [Cryptococcus deuterogattii 99/473]|nr:ribosome production factor 1 [Cryptococcus deuterogattii 99/473]